MYGGKSPNARRGKAMDCIDIIHQGVGRDLAEEEITSMFDQVKRIKWRVMAGKKAADVKEEVLEAIDAMAERQNGEAIAKKRAVQLQVSRRLQAVGSIMTNFAGREEKGLSALLVGSNLTHGGARISVDAMGQDLIAQWAGGFMADLEALGPAHMKIFCKGAMDKEISEALFSLEPPTAPEFTGPKEAMDIAKAMRVWQELARVEQNKAGAWIGKEPGSIVRQSHERSKLRAAGFERWKADITPLLDWDRVALGAFDEGIEADDFLKAVYDDIISGVHLLHAPREETLSRPSVIGSAAARIPRERVLHFKDGAAWFAYNNQYGRGNMREAYIWGLERAARTTALMRMLGPSPQSNFQNMVNDVVQSLRARGDHAAGTRVREAANRVLKNQLREVDGTLNIEGNPTLAAVGRSVRILENLNRLGGTVISSLTDASMFSSEMSYHGRSFLGSLLEGMQGLLRGRGSAEERRILASIGVFFESMNGQIASRFFGEELPGTGTALQQLFFRLNGMSWWTDSLKKAAGLMLGHDLALEKGLAWNSLTTERRRALGLYGIDSGQWDSIRSGRTRAADGRDYLTPDAVYDASDAMLANYLKGKGEEATPGRIAELRNAIAGRLRTYFADHVDYAVIEPDACTRSPLGQGTEGGTPVGEIVRFVAQFKSFPAVFMQRAIGRDLFGRGADPRGKALSFSENAEGLSNFARLFLMTTLFGYGAMSAKQLLAGKTPRDPANPKTWIAAAAQGGGLGIYGDFLFGERNRMGGGPVWSMPRPALGTADDLGSLYQRIRDGENISSNALRFAINSTPGNNIRWFRAGFDYLITYTLYEMLNPGSRQRMRRRVEKENSRTCWLKPVGWQ